MPVPLLHLNVSDQTCVDLCEKYVFQPFFQDGYVCWSDALNFVQFNFAIEENNKLSNCIYLKC